ncbi:hypothetical protein [Muricoccus radiodurans]|uniref:hypothetical protein n=1 Tax=Muricoccus radiodurans TaxID=2231721 RepID=UPI003CF20B2B
MPKPNYNFERREREKEKAAKAEAKKQKRLERKEAPPEREPSLEESGTGIDPGQKPSSGS